VKERNIESFDKDNELALTTNEQFEYANDGRLSKFVSRTVNDDSSVNYIEILSYNNDTIFGKRTMYIVEESVDTTAIDIPSQYHLNDKGNIDQYNLTMNLDMYVNLEQKANITYNENNEMTVYRLMMKQNENETNSTITSITKKQKNIFNDAVFDPVTRFYFLTGSLGTYLVQSSIESTYNIDNSLKQKLEISYELNEKSYPEAFTISSTEDDGTTETSAYTIKYKEVKQ